MGKKGGREIWLTWEGMNKKLKEMEKYLSWIEMPLFNILLASNTKTRSFLTSTTSSFFSTFPNI